MTVVEQHFLKNVVSCYGQNFEMFNNAFQIPINHQHPFGISNDGFPIQTNPHQLFGIVNNNCQTSENSKQPFGMFNNGFQTTIISQHPFGMLNNYGVQLNPPQPTVMFCNGFYFPINSKKFIDPNQFPDVNAAARFCAFPLDEQAMTVDYNTMLGKGFFGVVHKGIYDKKDVAVKVLIDKTDDDSKNDFLYEAAVMGQFDHYNVIKLIGVDVNSFLIVMELMENGSLKSFLPKEKLPVQTLRKFLSNIASGMKYLHDMDYVHRDLAARNILVNSELACKIADFGLARSLKIANKNSKQEPFYARKDHPISILWTAPEAMFRNYFTLECDVWSFGIVMWEVLTSGEDPYKKWKLSEKDILRRIWQGYTLSPLPDWPLDLQELMQDCLRLIPGQRLNFLGITQKLSIS